MATIGFEEQLWASADKKYFYRWLDKSKSFLPSNFSKIASIEGLRSILI